MGNENKKGPPIPFPPPQPGKIAVNPEHVRPKVCLRCASPFFIKVITMGTVSEIMSPTGSELFVPGNALICVNCHTPAGEEDKSGKNN